MMLLAEYVFWGSLLAIGYVYLGYPCIIWSASRLWPQRRNQGSVKDLDASHGQDEWPVVTIIVAAYREEQVILQRLNNAVLTNYPPDRLEILVGCDGDEDLTGDLVRAFNDDRVRLIPFPERRGKAAVLNDCVPQARGDILVFSDANTELDPNAVRHLARHFRDHEVGGVCGHLRLLDATTGENVDGMYWRYENFLKHCEGRFGVLLGMNGAIYAIRKELYQPIPSNTIIDDFLIGMRIYQQGYGIVHDEEAIAIEETAPTIQAEFQRRARIGAGGFQSLASLWTLLNPLRGRIAFAFWSHKVMRWMCPLFMLAAIGSNIALSHDPFYLRILLAHEAMYLAAFAGLWFAHGAGYQKLFRLPAAFVSMNAALLVGFFRWLRGISNGTWTRTERAATEHSERGSTTVSQSASVVTATQMEEVSH